ncbi:MAG: hypothetical protein QXF49_05075 [Thermosphaera sp.]
MDVKVVRGWAWNVANKLMEYERGEARTLERFMMDLRSANLPHEFTNVIANNMTIFRKAGIDVGEIPQELQYFSSITEFKEVKAVIIATFHNVNVSWSRVIEELNKKEKLNEEAVKSIAERCYVSVEFVKKVIDLRGR